MPEAPAEPRPRVGDSEKITINLGFVDLGQIDLLVAEGFYANRTDLIRTAIGNQLDRHADAVKGSLDRKGLELGLRRYSRRAKPACGSRSEFWAWPASPRTSPPSLPAP